MNMRSSSFLLLFHTGVCADWVVQAERDESNGCFVRISAAWCSQGITLSSFGKGGVSGGFSQETSCCYWDLEEFGMAPAWSCPLAVVLKSIQCHRAHF